MLLKWPIRDYFCTAWDYITHIKYILSGFIDFSKAVDNAVRLIGDKGWLVTVSVLKCLSLKHYVHLNLIET